MIKEARGEGRMNLGEALKALRDPVPQPQIAKVHLVKKDADGKVIEEVTLEYGDHR